MVSAVVVAFCCGMQMPQYLIYYAKPNQATDVVGVYLVDRNDK